MMLSCLVCLVVAFAITAVQSSSSSQEKAPRCKMTPAYPPPADRDLEWFVINLDEPANTRWNEPTLYFKDGIQSFLDFLFNGSDTTSRLVQYLNEHSTEILARYPLDFAEEVQGMQVIVDRSIGDMMLYNMAYEIYGLCTSIVAQDNQGHIYHARNLDFGLWPSVNWTFPPRFEMTDYLRNILYNANFTRNGEVLYSSVAYGGYNGLLTGVRKQAMTISVDTRFDSNFDKYLMDWFRNSDDDSQFLSYMTRLAIENSDSYSAAIDFMRSSSLIGPAYVIVGGVQPNEGSVLSFGPNQTLFDEWDIVHGLPSNNTAQAPFYVLETNYDHWDAPPWYDDRRYPAELCLDEIGSKGIDWNTLYNVLNGMPNRNGLTTYTALMDSSTGALAAYRQYCPEIECIPW